MFTSQLGHCEWRRLDALMWVTAFCVAQFNGGLANCTYCLTW